MVKVGYVKAEFGEADRLGDENDDREGVSYEEKDEGYDGVDSNSTNLDVDLGGDVEDAHRHFDPTRVLL